MGEIRPNQGGEAASHDHIASYTNPIVPPLFSPTFPSFSPLLPSFSCSLLLPFLRVSPEQVCVKLFKVHPQALLPPIPIASFLFELQPQQLAPKLKIEGLENFSSPDMSSG